LERIRTLYAAHEELMTAWAQTAVPALGQAAAAAARLEEARAAWDAAIETIDGARTKEMAAPDFQEPAKKALATPDRERDGLIAHGDYPITGPDNNTAEGRSAAPSSPGRTPAARGTRTPPGWLPRWTVTATAEMAGLNVLTYLTAYLDACGRNGGNPLAGPELDRFLPWKASPEDRHTWAQPPARLMPPQPPRQRRHRLQRVGTAHQHACPQDFRILTLEYEPVGLASRCGLWPEGRAVLPRASRSVFRAGCPPTRSPHDCGEPAGMLLDQIRFP
jgi:hypothetical protein